RLDKKTKNEKKNPTKDHEKLHLKNALYISPKKRNLMWSSMSLQLAGRGSHLLSAELHRSSAYLGI
ncbi:hypothetical protein L9F63_019683, partial [Diploptera punctata]